MAIVFLLVIAEQATAVSIDDAIVMDCALLIVTKLAKDLVTQRQVRLLLYTKKKKKLDILFS
ncbi:unnamed protein product [Brassica napus]|uniref:(rape) hypothetical protein n=1 Tax=Brassica napus TaxID=3708 RepID=A0A817ABA3_BRANA|nr:unnamed protein product [Brassica napus]